MHGSVYSFGATALTPSGGGVVSLQQCLAANAYTNLVRYHTTDGGRTWSPRIVSLAAG